MQYRRDNELIQNFLIAIDDIAGGGSLLANYTDVDQIDLNYQGVETVAYIGGRKALSQIELNIPLDCPTSSMAAISQSIDETDPEYIARGGFERVPLKNTALVPDCNHNMLRPSGIYEGSKESAEILEYMFTALEQENIKLFSRQGSHQRSQRLEARENRYQRERGPNW